MTEHFQLLKREYGFSFPQDFFSFQSFLEELSPDLLKVLNIAMAAPFLMKNNEIQNPIRESRYYNDPPEFFTLLNGNIDGLHWGYYLDDPNCSNLVVVRFYNSDAFELTISGDNLFEAIREHLERDYSTCLEYIDDDPDEADFYHEEIEHLAEVRNILQKYVTEVRPEIGWKYIDKCRAGKTRKIAAKTRGGMGIVVPESLYKPIIKRDNFQGWNYEPSQGTVEKLAKKARTVLAEGYPGAALKLGKDLWCYPEYYEISYEMLDIAYKALNLELLSRTLQIAIEFRQDCDKQRRVNQDI